MATEDELYRLWQDPREKQQRADIERELFAAVLKHANAIVWQKLHERNDELASRIAGEVINGLFGFRGDCKFSTWVQAIAEKQVKQEIRRRSRYRRVFDEKADLSEDNLKLSHEPDMVTLFSLSQLEGSLSPSEALLAQGILQGKDQNELAQELGITPRAAESRRRRLVEKLQKKVRRK